MKRIVMIALVGLLFSGVYTADAALVENSIYSLPDQSGGDRKEARRHRKEMRRAKRAEYRAKSGMDNNRMVRENIKQRKKIDKAARKENRRRWGQNELGDVFGVY